MNEALQALRVGRRATQFEEELHRRFELYSKEYDFKPGDLVKWKPGMMNRRMPSADGVAIVIQVLPEPVFDLKRKEAGHPLFREPLTVILGVLDEQRDFIEFHYDKRRFMPADENDAAPRVVSRLREIYQSLSEGGGFKGGDLVVWKPGLKNKKRPRDNEPAVVVEVLENPINDRRKDAGAPYFREPLDMKLGLLDEDGEFVIYHFDSRRFRLAP